MTDYTTSSIQNLYWNFNHPVKVKEPALVVFISDWIYGLLPYCGPGTRRDAWIREKTFQDEVCRYLNNTGIATLSLNISIDDNNPPADHTLIEQSTVTELTESLQQIIQEKGCSYRKTILFGHGFGTHLLCNIAKSGIQCAGYILAAGLYSDIFLILEQKYRPILNLISNTQSGRTTILDPETEIILKNFGTILFSARKGNEKFLLRMKNLNLVLNLPKDLFLSDNLSVSLLVHLNAPTLIINGSGDLDIPVTNAFFIEQKMKQYNPSVSRIILADCDHWFREMPSGSRERFIERLNGNCLYHTIETQFLKGISRFIRNVVKIEKGELNSPVYIPEYDGMTSSL